MNEVPLCLLVNSDKLAQSINTITPEGVKKLLEDKANPNAFRDKESILNIAVKYNPDVVILLLEAKASTSLTPGSVTPLYLAALRNNFEVAQALITAKADVNETCEDCNYETPLFVAVEKENFEMVKMLLEAKANVNHPRKGGITPLDAAILQDKDEKLITYLIETKAQLFPDSPILNIEDKNALAQRLIRSKRVDNFCKAVLAGIAQNDTKILDSIKSQNSREFFNLLQYSDQYKPAILDALNKGHISVLAWLISNSYSAPIWDTLKNAIRTKTLSLTASRTKLVERCSELSSDPPIDSHIVEKLLLYNGQDFVDNKKAYGIIYHLYWNRSKFPPAYVTIIEQAYPQCRNKEIPNVQIIQNILSQFAIEVAKQLAGNSDPSVVVSFLHSQLDPDSFAQFIQATKQELKPGPITPEAHYKAIFEKAIVTGNTSMVELLLHKRVDINIMFLHEQKGLLQRARESGSAEMVQLLTINMSPLMMVEKAIKKYLVEEKN